jgi:hypothetical protein
MYPENYWKGIPWFIYFAWPICFYQIIYWWNNYTSFQEKLFYLSALIVGTIFWLYGSYIAIKKIRETFRK